ncbi:4753_t:CDS:2 [Acaulospora morrowiae]|uniref:ATPase inhibitor, mitochondrial n=1 Tax=Acaulospora morrowiae TaxID=94023 RepID=A0A9N9B753_9GLOM|nr:4753_t:CDS:2 [Acaulospora morrowiae]
MFKPSILRTRSSRLLSTVVSSSGVKFRPSSIVLFSGSNYHKHLKSYYSSRPEGHIRDSDSAFSKKEKAVEDQWIRAHDAEKIKHLREELAKQKKKLKELEEDIEELDESVEKNKKD